MNKQGTAYDKELIDKQCEHIRLVHFALSVTALTLIYFIMVNWNTVPELVSDIRKLKSTVNAISQRDYEMIERFMPAQIINCKYSSEQAIQKIDLPGTWALTFYGEQLFKAPYLFVNTSTQVASFDAARITIEKIRDILTLGGGFLYCIESVKQNQILSDWLLNLRNNCDPLQCKGKHAVVFNNLQVINWPSSDNDGVIKGDMTAIHDALNRRAWQVIDPRDTTQVALYFKAKVIRLNQDEFAGHHNYITAYWEDVHNLTLSEAENWAKEKNIKAVSKKNVSILSIDFEGLHIGIIGPVIIISMLLYILAYARQIRLFIQSHPEPCTLLPFSSAWIGAVPNGVALVLSFLNVVIFLPLSAALTLWRFGFGLPPIAVLLGSTLTELISILLFIEGRRIAKILALVGAKSEPQIHR